MESNFYYQQLKAAFEGAKDPDNASKMKAYMKGNFEFYGIKSPIRKNLVRELIKNEGKPSPDVLLGLTGLLWSDPHREMQYAAMQINEGYLKIVDRSFAYYYEGLIGQKSWWDSVDWLAPKAMGSFFKRFPDLKDELLDKWMDSKNKWYIRSSILFQLHYKTDTDFDLLCSLIQKTIGSKEFFINKASGWALREYSKTNASLVINFIDAHPELSNLTRREGMKWLNNKKNN